MSFVKQKKFSDKEFVKYADSEVSTRSSVSASEMETPVGYAFVTDSDGYILLDVDGFYLVVPL